MFGRRAWSRCPVLNTRGAVGSWTNQACGLGAAPSLVGITGRPEVRPGDISRRPAGRSGPPVRAARHAHGARRLGAITCGCLFLLASPSAAEVLPGVSLGLRRDDDPESRAGSPGPLVGSVTPRLTLAAGSLVRVRAALRRRYDPVTSRATDGVGPLGLALERAFDHGEATAEARPSTRTWFHAGVRALRSRDVLALDRPPEAAGSEPSRWSGDVRARVPRLGGHYRVEEWQFQPALVPVARSLAWGATAYALDGPGTALLAGWEQRQARVGGTWLLRVRRPTVGIRQRLATWLRGGVDVSLVEVLLHDLPASRHPGYSLVLEGDGDAAGNLRARLDAQPELPPATSLAATRAFGDGRLTAAWESFVGVDGGLGPVLHLLRRARVELRDTVARANVIAVELAHVHASPFRGRGAPARVTRASGWLVRRLRHSLDGRVGVSFVERRQARPAGREAEGWLRFELSVDIRG